MSAHDRIREIEGELERDRDDLSRSLEALKSSLTLSSLMGQGKKIVDEGKERASEGLAQGVQSASAMIKENPLAAAAAGAGLSWVVKKVTEPGRSDPAPALDQRLAGLFEPSGTAPTDDEFWIADVDRLRERAADYLDMLDQAVTQGSAPMEELMRRHDDVHRALAQDSRRAMMRGLEALPATARDKAFRKREELYARHMGHSTSRGWVKPIGIGVMVAGAGLAAAWLLPKTAAETKAMGEVRDRVVKEVGGFLKANPGLSQVLTTKVLGTVALQLLRRR